MEYFNFEDASNKIPSLDLDDCLSLAVEANEEDHNECYDSLFFDKTSSLPVDHPSGPSKLKLINNVEIEVVPHLDDPSLNYPMFRAKTPCEVCAKMGLDCFLASRGTLITGCICCISLYRECSFTYPKIPRGFVSTFPGISEDAQVTEGTLTERRKALNSFEESRGRKNGARFPRDAVKILKQWLSEHTDRPYPNEYEKDELKQLTGLKRSQISNWLANARRRGKVRPASECSSPMLGAIDIPQPQQQKEVSELGPLDRWKASPPEHEPASMTAIARAMTSGTLPSNGSSQSSQRGSRASSRKNSSEGDSGFSMFQAPSVSSFETRNSSNSDLTFASSRSNRSKGSFVSSQDRRRRRRAPIPQRAAAQQAKSRNARIFQCTFCTDTFPAKYDWQRHEKSLHLALERWTCCPEGGTVTVPLTGCTHCVFCRQANPTPEHLESHNFTACQEKTLQERTFYRKDHLRQHLRLMHNAKFEPSMESWKSMTNEIKSKCGFCPSKFTTWQQRADHLAAHFRNGSDMSMWSNGWGFEPFVERLVENAIPPYLIDHERRTVLPYVARASHATPSTSTEPGLTHGSSADSICAAETDQMTKDSNCWARLEQELIKFVAQQKLTGVMPTDKQIQDRARLIIYEDEDPWNWTCADNEQWLDTFKYQQGIGGMTSAMEAQQLAMVPIMAPYVVRGGLKTGSRAISHPQARVSISSDTQFPITTSSSAYGSLLSTSAPVNNLDFDQNMELDFDSIDFSNLDLGMADDMGFNNDIGSHQALNDIDTGMQLTGNDGQIGTANNIFESFDLGLGMHQQQQQQPLQAQELQLPENYLTDEEINQLTGFNSRMP